MRWIAAFACLALAFSSAPFAGVAAAKDSSFATTVRAGDDIVIKNVRSVVPSANGSGAGGTVWYIVTFAYTNSTAYPMIPNLTKFTFQGPTGNAKGWVNGDPDLIGVVNNPHENDILKPGATYVYTVGFLIPSGVAGFIYYDRT